MMFDFSFEKKVLGLGSNTGSRRSHLTSALCEIEKVCLISAVSPVYETPALLPRQSPETWNRPYLNLALDIESDEDPLSFLKKMQEIETRLGRVRPPSRWSPRTIDIDLLLWGNQEIDSDDLKIPHPEMHRRGFVLDPLKDLDSRFAPFSRANLGHAPLWMAILNATPDSFSDGGELGGQGHFEKKLRRYLELGVHILDFGAESTRPGAEAVDSQVEIERLAPYLSVARATYGSDELSPQISVDTRHAKTAEWAIGQGVHLINDVSGLADPEMIEVLKGSDVRYVLMHSLGIPPSGDRVLQVGDPVTEIRRWFDRRIEQLYKGGMSGNRIIVDPGIGFGKSSLQSLEILRRLDEFSALPHRLLIGHSRKSFMSQFSSKDPSQRDFESVGVSLRAIGLGADILRVHNPEVHLRAWNGWSHVVR